jgi:hypothetical protein
VKRLITLGVATATLGCGPPDTSEGNGRPADPVSREDTLEVRLLRTESPSYTLESDGRGWSTSIDFTYKNIGSDTVYVVNCNGAVLMRLQVRDGGEWEDAWYPEGDSCLSPPIVIEPRTVHRGRVGIWGAELGSSSYNAFRTTELEGEFRLVWDQIVLHYSPGFQSFGDTLPTNARVSNSFRLERSTAGS